MICIFLSSVILLLAVSSAGFAFYALLGQSPRNPFLAFFMGIFLISLLAMAVSLVAPLNSQYSLLCLSPSLLGIKQLPHLFTSRAGRDNGQRLMLALFFATAAACALGAANATWPGNAYDTDLYHIQLVRWLNEFGTPPGLGNLHSRLANSSVWPLLAAVLNHSFLQDSIPWIMMPTFITAFTMYFIYDFWNAPENFLRTYALCMFPVCIYAIPFWDYPNLYHDFPSLALVCVIGAEFLFLCFSEKCNTINITTSILIFITLSFLIKPLSIVTVVFITPIALLFCYKYVSITARNCTMLFIFPLLAAAIWCTRNIITSGYPFFPISIFPFHVDWAMQRSDVAENVIAVRAWARMPGSNYMLAFERGITFWFLPWVKAQITSKQVSLTTLVPFVTGCVCWFFLRRQLFSFKALCLFCWPLLSLVYWFWMAPDPRFGREFFWLFFALGAACLVQYRSVALILFWSKFVECKDKQRYFCIMTVIFLMLICSAVSFKRSLQGNDVAWVNPGTIKSLPTKLVTASSGAAPFDVYVPLEDDRCGNSPLPCAPKVPLHIERRDGTNLGAGFRPKPHQP